MNYVRSQSFDILCIYILDTDTFLIYTFFKFKTSYFIQENDASLQGKGRKRAAPRGRGRGRGSTQSSKRGRKSDNTTTHRMLMSKDDDNDDDDDVAKRFNKSQPRVGFSFYTLFLVVSFI
jgi:hypothetical protein